MYAVGWCRGEWPSCLFHIYKLFTSHRYAQASPAGRVTVQQLVRNAQLLHSVTVW